MLFVGERWAVAHSSILLESLVSPASLTLSPEIQVHSSLFNNAEGLRDHFWEGLWQGEPPDFHSD